MVLIMPYNEPMAVAPEYFKTLKSRASESRAYKKYQVIGLEIAKILRDEKRRALYIKLCKDKGSENLLELAKNISESQAIKKKGAYFMACISGKKKWRK